MANEERIAEQLVIDFPFLSDSVKTQRPRRMYVVCPFENFEAVFGSLVENMQFSMLSTMTGLDEGENLSVYYHLCRKDGTLLSLKTSVSKAQPRIRTIISWFPSAELYERELVDLLGFEVEGLPPGQNRYPLTDDWPEGQYPLRKDWKASMLDQKEEPAEAEKKA